MWWIVWFVLFAVFLLCEAATPQLTTIWMALGAAAALAVCLVFPGLIWLQLAVFVFVSAVALLFTRKLAKRVMHKEAEPTNADRCIGQQCVVIEEINNIIGRGQVNIKGVIWTARSEDGEVIPPDALVTVLRIEGSKVIVK